MEVDYTKQIQIPLSFNEAIENIAKVNTKEVDVFEKSKNPQPFMKWAGGKRSVMQELLSRMPKKFNNYYEPFAGGGALFFELHKKIERCFLLDANLNLTIAYNTIKEECNSLIKELKKHKKKHNENYYYKIRNKIFKNHIGRAAQLIYLNRTCYNGLYRLNKSGGFNTPIGRYSNPDIVREENLKLVQKALEKAEIKWGDFTDISPKKNDFVYFDPPYHEIKKGSFTQYTGNGFKEEDQIRLRDFILKLHKKGVYIMLSNSDTPFIRKLYKFSFFNIDVIKVKRMINCKANKRNNHEELIITNYGTRRNNSKS
jgi:DNA adenine methylase